MCAGFLWPNESLCQDASAVIIVNGDSLEADAICSLGMSSCSLLICFGI